MQIPLGRMPGQFAVGLAAAALWGVLLEAASWGWQFGGASVSITRLARLVAAAEVGLVTAGVALLACLGCSAVPRLRRRLAAAPTWIPSLFGLACCVLLGIGFLVSIPPPETIRLSQDPLVLRLPTFGVGLLAALVVVAVGWRITPPRGAQWCIVAVAGVATVSMLAPPVRSDREGRPDVFLISIDTLRADHLGCYGYPLPTSPAIDALCTESVVFEAAMSAAPATIPSYTSLFSGTLQSTHGVYTNYDKVDASVATLAERLRDTGYETAAVLEGTFPGSFANVGQGFDLLVQRGIVARSTPNTLSQGVWSVAAGAISFVGEMLGADISVTTWAAERWLRSIGRDTPVFAHFYWPYPHDPYTPPARYLDLVPEREDVAPEIRSEVHRYDAEIRYADVQVGRVLDVLRELGRFDDAWVVFVSDHGEELGRVVDDAESEDGRFFGHSRYLFDTSVRVPLVVKPPVGGGVPRREPAVVSTASVAATLLGALDIPVRDALLAPLPGLISGSDAAGLALSLARNPSRSMDRASVRRGPWRLIESRKPTLVRELLHYEDGRESGDRSAEQPEIANELIQVLRALDPLEAGERAGPAPDLSERERAMLEELGYLE